ncbi:MAG TPA: ABC transporter ATP-binding protein [Mycobacteriales bacterium]|nr:ABC transporter ATP-binding protein [Mycobacteriales bacterium]
MQDSGAELGFFEVVRRLLFIRTIQRLSGGLLCVGIVLGPLQKLISSYLGKQFGIGFWWSLAYIGAVVVVAFIPSAVVGKRLDATFAAGPVRAVEQACVLVAVGLAVVGVSGWMHALTAFLVVLTLGQAVFAVANRGLQSVLQGIVDPKHKAHVLVVEVLLVLPGFLIGLAIVVALQNRVGAGGAIAFFIPFGVIAALLMRRATQTVEADIARKDAEIADEEAIVASRAAGERIPLLAVRGVNFSYGQLQVLFDVDFTVDEGEMVALLGTNGAGKSTLLKVVSGIGLPQSGTVRLAGHDITYLDAERRVDLGITQIPGGRAVFGQLNVIDNLRGFGFTLGAGKKAVEEGIDRCLAAFPRLAERRTSLASTLSGGEQQMLGLSKALMLRPKLLLIDELSLGLAPVIVGQLLDMVRQINAEGTAVVLVEQSVNIALSLVDHAYFMEKGQMRFDGPAKELLGRGDLLRAVFLEGATKGRAKVGARS